MDPRAEIEESCKPGCIKYWIAYEVGCGGMLPGPWWAPRGPPLPAFDLQGGVEAGVAAQGLGSAAG